jgi:hypothetical protein
MGSSTSRTIGDTVTVMARADAIVERRAQVVAV